MKCKITKVKRHNLNKNYFKSSQGFTDNHRLTDWQYYKTLVIRMFKKVLDFTLIIESQSNIFKELKIRYNQGELKGVAMVLLSLKRKLFN